MNVFVSRDGQTFGPYSVEQASEFLQSGQLLPTDFALYEGESEWKTLGALLGVPEQPVVTPIVQPQAVGTAETRVKGPNKISSRAKKGTKVKMNQA